LHERVAGTVIASEAKQSPHIGARRLQLRFASRNGERRKSRQFNPNGKYYERIPVMTRLGIRDNRTSAVRPPG
jgi:hypothetical protein